MNLEHTTAPNQEIVVQFTSDTVSQDDTQSTIAQVKEQLAALGIENVQVQELSNGQFKIAYYSNVAIQTVQQLFAQEDALALQIPFNTNKDEQVPVDTSNGLYQLSVYEIAPSFDAEPGLNGTLLEFETKANRYFLPDYYVKPSIVVSVAAQYTNTVKRQFLQQASILITTPDYEIPEVRAGPIA